MTITELRIVLVFFYQLAKNNIVVLINLFLLGGLGACSPRKLLFYLPRLFLVASETCLVSDIYWFPSLLIQYAPPAQSTKLKIICVKGAKSAYLDTFAIQTSYIAYIMVCSYSQGGGECL